MKAVCSLCLSQFVSLLLAFTVVVFAAEPSARGGPGATGLVHHPDYLLHDAGPMHPERPERLKALMAHLNKVGLLAQLTLVEARVVADHWITQVHSQGYLDELAKAARNAPTQLDPDTRVSSESLRVAKLTTGGVLAAVDAVMAGQVQNAFVAARPPGHHAFPDRAKGFCLINHVAVAAHYVRQRYNLERVLIVDWDVHHGDGTQEIFYEDPNVLYFSTHQYPFYPGTGQILETGAGEGLHSTINVPLPPGAGDEELKRAFEEQLLPNANAFAPHFVLISAGFDAHRDDPLANLAVTKDGYEDITRLVMAIAERHANRRVVSVLEGGYNLDALSRSVEAHVRALAGR